MIMSYVNNRTHRMRMIFIRTPYASQHVVQVDVVIPHVRRRGGSPRRRTRYAGPARASFSPESSSSESPSPRRDGAAEAVERPASEPSEPYPSAAERETRDERGALVGAPRAPNLDAPSALPTGRAYASGALASTSAITASAAASQRRRRPDAGALVCVGRVGRLGDGRLDRLSSDGRRRGTSRAGGPERERARQRFSRSLLRRRALFLPFTPPKRSSPAFPSRTDSREDSSPEPVPRNDRDLIRASSDEPAFATLVYACPPSVAWRC